MTYKSLADEEENVVPRVCVFGRPKTGKSLLVGKLAERFNLIWFDLENGHEVLFQLPKEWQRRISLIKVPDTSSYPIAVETMLKVIKATGPVEICHEHAKVGCAICRRKEVDAAKNTDSTQNDDIHDHYFATYNPLEIDKDTIVVVDSDTQLADSGIAHVTKNQKDEYKLDWDDWGKLGRLMHIFHSHVQNSKIQLAIISHETEAEEEGSKKKTIVPVAGTRRFSSNVSKVFSSVVYCEKKNKKHVFASSSEYKTNVLTGSRSGIAIEDMEEPSLIPLFRPEEFPQLVRKSSEPKKPTTTAGGQNTNEVLERLKAKSASK